LLSSSRKLLLITFAISENSSSNLALNGELFFNAEAIEAHTFPDKKITSKYIEEAGFVIEDIELNYLGTGKALFRIRRDDALNWKYQYRDELGADAWQEFEALAESGGEPEVGKPFMKISADKLQDSATLEKIKTFMQKHNLVITRYFPEDKENPKYFVLAFEKKIAEPEPSAYIV